MSDIGTFFIGHLSVGVNKVAYEEAIPVKYHSGAEIQHTILTRHIATLET